MNRKEPSDREVLERYIADLKADIITTPCIVCGCHPHVTEYDKYGYPTKAEEVHPGTCPMRNDLPEGYPPFPND
ncbi:hypothetical protein [Sinomonas sp. G460-2]|uniref:hypothetical protein n=1 Tax=Sinomonas sp. G460-2 TaxID=3393464 RepID=UPI0039EE36EC